MYRVYVNDETNKDVRIQFQDVYDYIIDKGQELDTNLRYCIDYFHDAINEFFKLYPNLKDNIDVLDSYDYSISCETEEEASNIEDYFESKFEDAQDIIYDIIEELEEELEEECEE